MLQTPVGNGRLELFEYIHPDAVETEPTQPNDIGMHRVAVSVGDIDEALEIAARHGCHPLRGVATYVKRLQAYLCPRPQRHHRDADDQPGALGPSRRSRIRSEDCDTRGGSHVDRHPRAPPVRDPSAAARPKPGTPPADRDAVPSAPLRRRQAAVQGAVGTPVQPLLLPRSAEQQPPLPELDLRTVEVAKARRQPHPSSIDPVTSHRHG